MGSLWNPFSVMADVDLNRLVLARGEGVHVFDEQGRRYLDASAALWFCHIGYGRSEMSTAIAQQASRLHTFHLFGAYANLPALAIAERLATMAPIPGGKVFLTSGGSDAVDSAAKLILRYFQLIGQPDRQVLLSRTGSYHGMHGLGTSLAGIEANRVGYGESIASREHVWWDSISALEKKIDEIGPRRLAGFFCEPVLGAGGVRFAPPGYLKQATRVVHEAGGLFIANEVITGFGRMGAWFGSTRVGIEPDLITFAKGITSGYVPFGGVIASSMVAEPFWSGELGEMWRHGYTYSGHAVAAAAALANLDIIEREDLLGASRRLEGDIHEIFGDVADERLISEVRLGPGAMAGLQLSEDALSAEPGLASRLTRDTQRAGVILRVLHDGTIQVSPPLVATRGDLEEIADVISDCLAGS